MNVSQGVPHAGECRIFLVRHGATANNLANPPRLQGNRTNAELSDEGRRQAELTGTWLARHSLSAVYASPLTRARQTAQAVAGKHGLDVQTIKPLIEIDVGDWEGRDWEEVARTEPEAHALFLEDPRVHPYRGGENMGQLLDRVVPALEKLARSHAGQMIAVVAHNVVNRCYIAELVGLPMNKARGVPQDNCGINLLVHNGRRMKVRTVNSIAHLETR